MALLSHLPVRCGVSNPTLGKTILLQKRQYRFKLRPWKRKYLRKEDMKPCGESRNFTEAVGPALFLSNRAIKISTWNVKRL